MNIMGNMVTMSAESFAKMSNLDISTVEDTINAEKICYTANTKQLTYPISEQHHITIDDLLGKKIAETHVEKFSITFKSPIVEIVNKECPALLFFKLQNWETILKQEAFITENMNIMVITKTLNKILLGEEQLLARLTEQFTENYDIIKIETLTGK